MIRVVLEYYLRFNCLLIYNRKAILLTDFFGVQSKNKTSTVTKTVLLANCGNTFGITGDSHKDSQKPQVSAPLYVHTKPYIQ